MSTGPPADTAATPIEDRIGLRGIWWPTDAMRAPDAAEFAAWVEGLGYGALWIPETLGRALGVYIGLPNYYKNWFRLGFDEGDLAECGSDQLTDALVPWGTADQIEARVAEHVDAGATHVCLQPFKPSARMGEPDRDALEALAPR